MKEGRKFGNLALQAPAKAAKRLKKASNKLDAAIDEFAAAGKEMVEASHLVFTPVLQDLEDKEARAKVVQLVNHIAFGQNVGHRATFVELYHNFFKSTGMHPVVESTKHGFKHHLDAVEKAGKLPELIDEACKMLQKA